MSIIDVRNLTHSFGEKDVFKSAEFKLMAKEHIGLVGENGKGKSTFMKIIANKLMPDEGDIYLHPKIKIGYMDQHTELKSGETIFETLRHAFD